MASTSSIKIKRFLVLLVIWVSIAICYFIYFLNNPKFRSEQSAKTNSRSLLSDVACQIGIATAEFLKIGFLGNANICAQFRQCCDTHRSHERHQQFFKPCIIPCDAVYWNADSSVPYDAYFASQEYKAKGRMFQTEFPIKIRHVNNENKQYVPLFRDAGFAFRDLSKFESLSSETSKYSMTHYNQMINRLSRLSHKILPGSVEVCPIDITKEEQDMLLKICGDFAESNNKRIISNIETKSLIKARGDGRTIHFDEKDAGINFPMEGGTIIRVWIPLSDIDNYPLTVGDARAYYKLDGPCSKEKGKIHINACAEKKGFEDAIWYQQPVMTTNDAIFWNKQTVPHGSVNLADDKYTKERVAFSFEFVVRDINVPTELTFGNYKHLNTND